MPIVKSSNLPTYDRLLSEGRHILDPTRAADQDIRPLHIGFCNLMPDAALEATERQWFRLIGESNRVAQINIHPFTLPVIGRTEQAQAHINTYYKNIENLKNLGLDALIITGANMPVEGLLEKPETWQDLKDLYQWAENNVTSVISSCFASYAYMAFHHAILPIKHETKRHGVYPHYVTNRQHPITRGTNTKMDVCHSRWGEIKKEDYLKANMMPLIESRDIGVHLCTSQDGFRHICFQGHPEYDTTSLLKEYKREVSTLKKGATSPPLPNHYFGPQAQKLIEDYLSDKFENFPEKEIAPLLENTWTDSARSIMANWVGLVYQLTHVDRQKQFMDGINPDNPLGL